MVEKQFVNEMTVGYLRDEVNEREREIVEEEVEVEQDEWEMAEVECMILDGEYEELIERYLSCCKRERRNNKIQLVFYCLHYQQLANLKQI